MTPIHRFSLRVFSSLAECCVFLRLRYFLKQSFFTYSYSSLNRPMLFMNAFIRCS
jgi:hypothetical protein